MRNIPYLMAVTLPVPARGFMPPQLETHDGSDQVHNHGDEQEDDGGCLACLCSAEGSVDAIVEHRVGAEAPAGGIANINDACRVKVKVQLQLFFTLWVMILS